MQTTYEATSSATLRETHFWDLLLYGFRKVVSTQGSHCPPIYVQFPFSTSPKYSSHSNISTLCDTRRTGELITIILPLATPPELISSLSVWSCHRRSNGANVTPNLRHPSSSASASSLPDSV